MTFLQSIINDFNNINSKYEEEFDLWQSLSFLHKFNTRIYPDTYNKYPIDGKFNILTTEQIKKVLLFLKEKEINVTPSDLDYDYISHTLLDTEWNTLVISIFNIDDSNIQSHIKESQHIILMVFARNYNVLRIMSGLGGLKYSN